MPTILGSLRRLILAPSLAEVTFAGRGFPPAPREVVAKLESIPQAVVVGFEAGIEARNLQEVNRRLDLVTEEHRGFAYEGATMAYTVLDAVLPGRRSRTRELLLGPAEPYLFLTYIGIGFAMARLPRPRWGKVLPDLTGEPYYPGLSWLAVDGYGFDLAYFHPQRWVEQQRRPRPYPWLGEPEYFLRAVDQGIGRALWFIHGAQVAEVAAAVGRFPVPRRPDLWSGVGLAAAFAGGADAGDLSELGSRAGEHWPELAQGAVFAAKARSYAELVPAHTEVAVSALAGHSVEAAAGLVDTAVATAGAASSAAGLDYERWRTEVRQRLAGRTGG